METYIWKSLLCSAIFIGIYFLVFEKQKNHHFKRFFLLSGIVFSLIIPLISFTYGVQEIQKLQDIIYVESETTVIPITTETSIFTLENILFAGYTLVAVFLLFRFCLNLFRLIKDISNGEKIQYGKNILVLEKKQIHPYSFWNHIFLNKADFENQKIDEKILIHEEAHLDQKHSVDILFVEFLLAVFWFNPALYFYRKAIITNHEFLADEAVLSQENNIPNYQKLLLSELISERILFTHPFNLSNTKKRIKMMTTPKNKTGKYLSWLTLPLSGVLFFVFAEKIPAQIEESGENVSAIQYNLNSNISERRNNEEVIREFNEIVQKYSHIVDSKDGEKFLREVPREVQEKLINLSSHLSYSQQMNLPVIINYIVYNKDVPTKTQLKQFVGAEYAVEIDGQKVDNRVLANYKNTDFSLVYVMKVHPKNPDYDYRLKNYSVVLMTNQYYKQKNASREITVGFPVQSEAAAKAVEKQAKEVEIASKEIESQLKKVEDEVSNIPSPQLHSKTVNLEEAKQVDQVPEFPGGLHAFRTKVVSEFNPAVLDATESLIKSEANYEIDEEGNLKLIVLTGDNEKFKKEFGRTLMKIASETKWKPAMKDGKPVKFSMKLPLTMNFETNPGIKK